MKKTVAFAVSVLLVCLSLCVHVVALEAQNWYCVRNKEHKQPVVGNDIGYAESFGGYYIDRAHGDGSEKKVVYLTFDAGYENGNVERIVDVLAEKKVTGAFFVLQNLVEKHPDLIEKMLDGNNLVCNHTATHPDMTTKTTFEEFKAELEALEISYRETTGRELSKYFRPPEGRFNRQVLEYAQNMGYKTIFWSFAYEDWDNEKQMSCDKAKAKILDNIHNGAVILLHPTSKTNADILGEVIDELRAQGYEFGTLDELTAN